MSPGRRVFGARLAAPRRHLHTVAEIRQRVRASQKLHQIQQGTSQQFKTSSTHHRRFYVLAYGLVVYLPVYLVVSFKAVIYVRFSIVIRSIE